MFFTKNKGVRRHYVVKKVKLKAPNSPTENGWKGEKSNNKIAYNDWKQKLIPSFQMFQIDCDWFIMVEKIMKLWLSKCFQLISKLDYLFIVLEEIFEISSFQLV